MMMMSKEPSATRRKPVVQGSSNDRPGEWLSSPVNKKSYTVNGVKPNLAQSGEVGGFWSLWSSSLSNGNSNSSFSGSSTATPISAPHTKINDVDIASPQSPASMFKASAKEIGKYRKILLDSDDETEHYDHHDDYDDDDASWNKAKVQPYPSLAPNNLNSKSPKVSNDALSSSPIPTPVSVSAAPKSPFDVTLKNTPNDDPRSVISSPTGTYCKTLTTSTRVASSSPVAAESKPQKAASDSNLLSWNKNNTSSATIPCTTAAASTPVTAKERMGGKRFSNALLTFDSPCAVKRNYRISQWARSKQANFDLLEPYTEDLPLTSELELARERLKAVTTKERPVGGGFHSTEADLLKQLRQWKNFASGNVQEEKEYQQYLMDLLQALKSVSSNLFPKTLTAQEVNDLGYATVPLKKVLKELDTRESSHVDAVAIGSILKTLQSIGSETSMDQAQDIVQDAIDRLRHVESYSKLYDGQQKDVHDGAEQLQRVSDRMTEREENALATALRYSDHNDNRAMDDFVKILIELKRNLRRTQPVQRQSYASQVPLVNLKRASCVKRQLPESHGHSATLRKTNPVNRELSNHLSNHQGPSVQLRKTAPPPPPPSKTTEGEQYVKKARKCLGSIDIQPDEAHALARMIVNLKNAGDYQNQPDFCDEEILALSIALSEDTFDQVSDLIDEYCRVVLNRPHREELIDLIFGSVVEEKGGNDSDSDFSSDDEDDDDFDEESQYGGSITDWIEQIEQESVYTEETAAFDDDQFEVASRDEEDDSESTDDESMDFVPAQDPVEKIEDLINKVSLNISKCSYPSPPPVSPKAFISKQKIGIIRKHKWTNSKFRNTIVNTNRWRASETFGVDRCLYSPLSNDQLTRRKTVGAALLRNMVDSLPEFPALHNNGTEEKDDIVALLTTTKSRASVIYLDSPAGGKSFVVRASISDALAQLNDLAEFNDLDF